MTKAILFERGCDEQLEVCILLDVTILCTPKITWIVSEVRKGVIKIIVDSGGATEMQSCYLLPCAPSPKKSMRNTRKNGSVV